VIVARTLPGGLARVSVRGDKVQETVVRFKEPLAPREPVLPGMDSLRIVVIVRGSLRREAQLRTHHPRREYR
jgi:hypothetical protein